MLRFQNIEYLYLLTIVPIIILIFVLSQLIKKKNLEKLGNTKLLFELIPDLPKYKPLIKFSLLSLALISSIFALANLQIGSKLEEVKREGIDAIFAIDVSNSMKAEDIKPNRLESTKQAISRLVDKLRDDRIGLIVFAGDAYLQLPLTPDHSAVKLLLDAIDTDVVPIQGTAIGSAIRLAIKALPQDDKKHKVLIIITDGENHEDDAIGEAKNAASQGLVVHTIGIGSPLGAPIPIYQNNQIVGYKKDKQGNIIITKLDESALQQIAIAGNGKYFQVSSQQRELDNILNEIASMEKKEFSAKIFTEYNDQFQYFLIMTIVLILIEFFISEKRNKWLKKLNLFEGKKL